MIADPVQFIRTMDDTVRRLISKEYCIIFDVAFPMELQILDVIGESFLNVMSSLCHTEDNTHGGKMSIFVINSNFRVVMNRVTLKGNMAQISSALDEIKLSATFSGRPEENYEDSMLIGLNSAAKNLNESFKVIEVNADCNTWHLKKDIKTTAQFHKVPGVKHLVEQVIQNLFLATEFDREDLQLVLPDIIIKCDAFLNMVRTEFIPYGGNLQLCPRSWGGARHSKNDKDIETELQEPIKIFKLEAINRVSSQGVCESHIFGPPIKLFPARCLIEGRSNTFEENEQRFTALWSLLRETDEYLILKQLGPELTGFFLLMPSDNTILLKCLISGELLLPSKAREFTLSSVPPDVIKNIILNSLSDVPEVEEYEPLENMCGLYQALRHLPQTEKIGKANHKRYFSSMTKWANQSHPTLQRRCDHGRCSKKMKMQSNFEQVSTTNKTKKD